MRKELEAMLPPGAIIAGPKGWLSIPYGWRIIKQAAKAGLPLKKGCQGCAEAQSLKFCRVDGGQNAACQQPQQPPPPPPSRPCAPQPIGDNFVCGDRAAAGGGGGS